MLLYQDRSQVVLSFITVTKEVKYLSVLILTSVPTIANLNYTIVFKKLEGDTKKVCGPI